MIISIFNGFPFHYETFGVFIYTIIHINPKAFIRLFTNQKDNMGWITYYCDRFPISSIQSHEEFTPQDFLDSTFIIVATDDDGSFPIDYMKLPDAQKKVICYDHNIAL